MAVAATAAPPFRPLQQQVFIFRNYPSVSHKTQFRPLPQFSSTIRAASALARSPTCRPAIYRSGFKCKTCNKTYTSRNPTLFSGTKAYNESKPAGLRSSAFCWSCMYNVRCLTFTRSSLLSFLYERGWLQSFTCSGFPGPDEEMAQLFFKPTEGDILIDVSCGSGLFSRKFARSRSYSGVIALDFSENMLRQWDKGVIPFRGILANCWAKPPGHSAQWSVDAVNAGAALHCWPSPSNAVAEINRALQSGGIFVGTTFLRVIPFTPAVLRPFGQRVRQNYNFLTAEKIEDLCTSCGLVNYTSNIQQSFIMFSAQKP